MNGNNHSKFLGVTPMDERIRFIKFLGKSGFTHKEIRQIYPTMSIQRITKILTK